MAIDKLPWYSITRSGTNYSNITEHSGTSDETRSDVRSALVRTPRGRWRPPTSYSRSVRSGANTVHLVVHNETVISGVKYKADYTGANNCSGFWYAAPPSFPPTLEARAIMKARIKAKGESVNIAQNFGERDQLARQTMTTLGRLYDGVRAVRHLDPVAAAAALGVRGRSMRNLKVPFDMWLELQYGWKPLLSDIHSATTALSHSVAERKPSKTIIATQTEKVVGESVISASNVPTCIARLTRRTETEHKCKIRFDLELDNPLLKQATELGLTNPAELAWELLPFSFVADWFVPVGSFLSQLDASFGWAFKGGSISKKTTMKTRCTSVSLIPDSSGAKPSGYGYASGKGYQMNFSRSTYSSMPFPDYRALAPKSPFDDSGQHVANGIALLAGLCVNKVLKGTDDHGFYNPFR